MGRPFGIEVRASVLVIPGIIFWFSFVFQGRSAFLLTLCFASIALSILLHELSHAVVAKIFGREVFGIVLIPPFAGLALLDLKKEKHLQNLLISLSGPSASLVVGGALFILLNDFRSLSLVVYLYDNYGVSTSVSRDIIRSVRFTAAINLFMGIFNMVPLYPLDGGRCLRDVLLLSRMTVARANLVTLCVSTISFLGLSAWTLVEKNYYNLPVLIILMAISFLSLSGFLDKRLDAPA